MKRCLAAFAMGAILVRGIRSATAVAELRDQANECAVAADIAARSGGAGKGAGRRASGKR